MNWWQSWCGMCSNPSVCLSRHFVKFLLGCLFGDSIWYCYAFFRYVTFTLHTLVENAYPFRWASSSVRDRFTNAGFFQQPSRSLLCVGLLLQGHRMQSVSMLSQLGHAEYLFSWPVYGDLKQFRSSLQTINHSRRGTTWLYRCGDILYVFGWNRLYKTVLYYVLECESAPRSSRRAGQLAGDAKYNATAAAAAASAAAL